MTPSFLIDEHPLTNRSRSRSTGNVRTRARSLSLPARAPQTSLPKLTTAHAPAKKAPKPLQSNLINPVVAAKSP
jgi:hypothetical protein